MARPMKVRQALSVKHLQHFGAELVRVHVCTLVQLIGRKWAMREATTSPEYNAMGFDWSRILHMSPLNDNLYELGCSG